MYLIFSCLSSLIAFSLRICRILYKVFSAFKLLYTNLKIGVLPHTIVVRPFFHINRYTVQSWIFLCLYNCKSTAWRCVCSSPTPHTHPHPHECDFPGMLAGNAIPRNTNIDLFSRMDWWELVTEAGKQNTAIAPRSVVPCHCHLQLHTLMNLLWT